MADFEMGNINVNGFGQIPGKGADLDFKEHVFEDAAACFHTRSFTDGLDGNIDCDFFVFGHFVEIDVERVATQCVMLHFLDQREALGTRIFAHSQIDQERLTDGMVNEIFEVAPIDFEVLWLGLAAINYSGNAARFAEALGPGSTSEGTRKCFECDSFHVVVNSTTTMPYAG